MIYTTNWIERLNRDIRKGTRQRLSFPNSDSALNLIWAIVIDREEKTYRYPVTAFLPAKDELDGMFPEMGEQYHIPCELRNSPPVDNPSAQHHNIC